MISLLPSSRETLVVALPWEQTLARITKATTEAARSRMESKNPNATFTGWVKADEFSISLTIRRPNNFIPVLTGRIDPTSQGCIVFMRYRLFQATRIYLIFWTLFTFSAGALVSYYYHDLRYLLLGSALTALLFWIAWANFNIQRRITRAAFMQLLS